MTDLIVDARGLACPEPVIKVKKALATNPDGLTVWVDNKVAVENIKRFVTGKGYSINISEVEADFKLVIG